MVSSRFHIVLAPVFTLLVGLPAIAAPNFNRDVAPVLVKRCLECHSPHKASGGLVLTEHARLLKGGESGAVVDADKPADSYLLERITTGEMPPKQRGESQKLPANEIRILREWIIDGAKWPKGRTLDLYESTSDVRGGRDWWSLQPVVRPQVPQLPETSTNPIDAFIASKLAANQLEPAPPADRRTLIRRLYYDLIGLPPTHEQIEAFVADKSDNAWMKLVDDLLESPHYGERWARYWLDLVRFAETCGYERDQTKPFAWKYRDWVVNALNSDMPYDQFVIHQLAGDEIPNRTEKSVTATGLMMLGTWNDEPNDGQDYKYDRLEDLVHSTSSAFLGLTVKCARCHDHKFDPIPQVDYYRIASAFWGGAIEPRDRKFLGGPTPEELGLKNVLGWTDLKSVPSPLHVLKAGNRQSPQQVAVPGPLSAVPAMFKEFSPPPKGSKTSHRRLQLARWIANPANPLTARVLVNRLWQHHFGRGIVRSPNNFGFRGDPPTHPKLLDWLAAEFVSGGWKIKRMHRLILSSTTWRQSSLHPKYENHAQRDFTNRLCWRANRRRLDAEALRDSMLAVSGEIDLKLGGESFLPRISPDAKEGLSRKASAWNASSAEQQLRRSLYIFTKRHLLVPMMTSFDFCDTTLPTARRNITTVAPQALVLLNNSFSHGRSSALARRIMMTHKNRLQRIESVWKYALGREPQGNEVQLGAAHVLKQFKRFSSRDRTDDLKRDAWRNKNASIVQNGLVLHLRADAGVESNRDGRVSTWKDQSTGQHHASQSKPEQQPLLVNNVIGKRPVIRFDGKRRFLDVAGKLLTSQTCSIFAVASDVAGQTATGHREIISNWNGGAGNSTTSVFLGLTNKNQIRFSDAFGNAGQIVDRTKPFLLTAINSSTGASVFQQATELRSQNTLPSRKLDTPWVIGQQGNINGEYWHGDIAEILVYDRGLTVDERRQVWSVLLDRYGLPSYLDKVEATPVDPELLALASLCHVLLNSNEFIYVD